MGKRERVRFRMNCGLRYFSAYFPDHYQKRKMYPIDEREYQKLELQWGMLPGKNKRPTSYQPCVENNSWSDI
jgi:hypothetical protein